jgi:predicted Fe-S protein YdhL (DUF1289 family)
MSIPSPCVGTCRIDEASGFCVGCARTKQEIKFWRDADIATLEGIWNELPGRRTQLGISLHRLDWTGESIRSFTASTLRPDAGTWVFGTFGAVGEFCVGQDESVDLELDLAGAVAQTQRGAIRLEFSADVRALSLMNIESGRPQAIIFAVSRSRFSSPPNPALAALGSDDDAIRTTGRIEALYDLGLGMEAARFCIRTADTGLVRALDARIGCRWPELLADLGGQILHSAPTRAVLSSIGRIEVFTPIPPPGGHSPEGPHTHFLPVHIGAGRETPPGMDLPEILMPCAMFYPGRALIPDVSVCE